VCSRGPLLSEAAGGGGASVEGAGGLLPELELPQAKVSVSPSRRVDWRREDAHWRRARAQSHASRRADRSDERRTLAHNCNSRKPPRDAPRSDHSPKQ
jgi:hypothetical protein